MAASHGIPALGHLPFAIRNAQSGPSEIRALANCLQEMAGELPWYQRQEPALPDFMRGHANAFIIGPSGLEQRSDVIVGVSLLAPEIEYPGHNHPPEELYVVMSDGDWRQNKNPWHAPGLGGLVCNPANITHSMRSGPKPLLAIWCLWTQMENATGHYPTNLVECRADEIARKRPGSLTLLWCALVTYGSQIAVTCAWRI
ncbi:MAG: dimethylsulfonioproprionate lyase family protein [Alphaproteobacteria bacterium]|nr:dimethylsulfonioproprionate lyase family protein [Alphaproteobacteria bacterium]